MKYLFTLIAISMLLMFTSKTLIGQVQTEEYTSDEHTVLLLHLNETSGNLAYDESSYGNNGTIHTNQLSEGKFFNGRSFPFNNVDQGITLPYNPSLNIVGGNPIGMECWIKTNPYNQAGTGMIILDDYQLGLGSYGGQGHLQFFRRDGNDWNICQVNNLIPMDEWVHVMATYDGNNTRMYINGIEQNYTVFINVFTPINFIRIASFNGQSIHPNATILIDEVRISNIARVQQAAPIADAGDDQTVECSGSAGTEVMLDGTGSSDPDGDELTYNWTWDGGSAIGPTPTVVLPSGTTTITLIVNDGIDNSEPDEVDITVEDDSPPEIIIGREILTLWPPNHKYETINLNDFDIEVIDSCDNNVGFDDVLITSVSSDEEENDKGDGNTVDDIVLVDCQEVKLRKERSGSGNGRVYSINISVTDNSGNSATATCYVTVPHNKKKDAVDDGILYSINGCSVNGARRDFTADYEKEKTISPKDLRLAQNFPNPFNPTTLINYTIPEGGLVTLIVYDVLGTEVASLVNEYKGQGNYNVTFNASNLPSGIYVYQLRVNRFVETKKMILIK